MIYRLKAYIWGKFFSLDRLLAGLSKLVARLEKLAALRRSQADNIDNKINVLYAVAKGKRAEAERAERVKGRFEALTQ